MNREKIGSGLEHTAYLSHNRKWVLKRQHPIDELFSKAIGYTAEQAKEQIKEAQKLIENAPGKNMRLAHTRVFTFGDHYIIAQEYIPTIGDAATIFERVSSQGSPELTERARRNPTNFIPNGDEIVYIDPIEKSKWFWEQQGPIGKSIYKASTDALQMARRIRKGLQSK